MLECQEIWVLDYGTANWVFGMSTLAEIRQLFTRKLVLSPGLLNLTQIGRDSLFPVGIWN
jgi:hypothetical protein